MNYGFLMEKRHGAKKEMVQNIDQIYLKIKIFKEMTLVTSKNHRNETLKNLIKKINFKKVVVMGSIGCKIASIVKGRK